MTSKLEDPSPDDVAASVERIRAGARQRQAENAALEDELAGWPPPLEALRRYERLVEPSFDAESGGRAVWLQKVFYHLFAKRGHRALLRQQNEFNRQVGLALRDVCDRQRRLGARMTALEDRPDARGRSDEEHARARSDEDLPGARDRNDEDPPAA